MPGRALMVVDALIRLLGSDLPEDTLVSSYLAEEALSRPFRVQIDFSTGDTSFVVDDLLRKSLVLEVTSAGLGSSRLYSGVVAEADFERVVGERLHFRVVLRPSLWLLGLREDSRIFQEQTTPDIVRTLLDEAGLTSTSEWLLAGRLTHSPHDFKVQFRESPLNFIQRLCEDAGIFYYFTHTAEGHVVHFCDDLSSLEDLGPPVALSLGQSEVRSGALTQVRRTLRLRPSSVNLRDFDVRNPGVLPDATAPLQQRIPQPVHGYPGGFTAATDGEALARARLSSLRHDADTLVGSTESVELFPGRPIEIGGVAEADATGEFIVASTTTSGSQHAEGSITPHASLVRFRAFPQGSPYLPPALARRPRISGLQTARVVGPERQDQSIHVDELGRIKLHFFWDRLQEPDDRASCWIRVSQLPLGGSMILPRVGWEMSVAFLEGDPDRPIVLGRVYNSENMPPLALPDNKAAGALTSMSTPGGAGKNEISVGDSGGKQGFSISAQKDLNLTTGYDQTETIAVDDESQVNENTSRSVGVDDLVEIAGNQTMSFGAHCNCKVGGDLSVTVGGNETLNSTANLLEKVKSNRSFEVGGNQMLLCNGERTKITGALSRTVGAAEILCTTSSSVHDVATTSTSSVGAVRVYLSKGDQGEVVTGAKAINVAAAVAHSTKGDFGASCEGATARLVGGVVQRKIQGDLTIKAPLVSLVGAKGKFKGGSSVLDLNGGPITVKGGKLVIKSALIKKSGQMKLG